MLRTVGMSSNEVVLALLTTICALASFIKHQAAHSFLSTKCLAVPCVIVLITPISGLCVVVDLLVLDSSLWPQCLRSQARISYPSCAVPPCRVYCAGRW